MCLLRSRWYHSVPELMLLFKGHVLFFIEYRAPALAHVLDAVQDRFLRAVGISARDACVHFRLAPLATRRDMAMLG
eukprot:3278279-Pyramimonas_sp.AAC.1